MNAGLPVFVLWPMALPAEPVAFREVNEFSIINPQFVSIFCIMTVEAPPHGLRMMQLDLGMFI